MAQACEAVLDELGWETTARMATRWSHPMETDTQASSRSRKAFVVATTTDEIQLSRITGTPSVIFVLDTTPASLIKTYGQIKSLIGQRNDLGSRLGLVFVSPFGDGRERLLASCQHFLSIQPRDLGTVSRSLIDDAERHWPNAARNWAESVAKDWHPFVARCLDQQLT
ncbi:MAG: hypothetical protein JNL67_21375 [Planctomycetaceae bacterium]|nr:hypothetical protein [Planctomycetaceae bacterium]